MTNRTERYTERYLDKIYKLCQEKIDLEKKIDENKEYLKTLRVTLDNESFKDYEVEINNDITKAKDIINNFYKRLTEIWNKEYEKPIEKILESAKEINIDVNENDQMSEDQKDHLSEHSFFKPPKKKFVQIFFENDSKENDSRSL